MPKPTLRERADDALRHALLQALGGGSCRTDGSDDERMAQRLLTTLTPDNVLSVFRKVALATQEEGDREMRWERDRLIRAIEQLAEETDSLRIHRFIENHKSKED